MPIAEITRAETRERARLLQVDSYDVTLDLTRGDKIFGSTSVIRFDCAEPGAASHADLVAETVHEVVLNGEPLDPAACANGRIPLPGLATHNELRVVADCAYTNSDKGMHRSADSADGRVYTYANFEPAYARGVYANFEQPDLKAAFTFHITAPAHWTVLSNQPTPEPEPAGGDSATWHFSPTPRIPTYITTVAAGDYQVVTADHTTPAGQHIPLSLACRASLAGHLDADAVFEVTRQGLDYFTELFGSGYPFAQYGHVFVPEYPGAMEKPGCVLITEQLLFRSKVTETMYELRAMVILHEMAHMWFGDMVTMQWWDDLWLNESFAEFCGHLATAEATRFTDAWATFSVSRKLWGLLQDQLPSTHPVAADAPTVSEATSNFDGISYAKGASVLRQLVAYVGRERFFAAIRAYFAAHSWANARLADLIQAIEENSGKSLTDWSKAWLETAGPNTLRSEFETGADGAFTSFAIRQEAPERYPALRPHHVAVGLYNRAGDRFERTSQVEVEVTGARTLVPALAGTAQPDLLLLNDGDLDFVLVRLDPRSLRTVTESIGGLADPLARAVCWGAALDMVLQAELPVPTFVTMLANGMRQEPSVAVGQILLALTQQMMVQLADPAWVADGKRQLAATAVELLRAAEPASGHQLAWAQLLGWTATSADQLDLVAGLLDGSATVDGLVVDTELRWALLQRLAATGRAGDAEIDAELARDATDAGRRHAAGCRAAIGDAEHKEAAWQQLAAREFGVESTVEVAHGFAQPEQAELLAPYAERYFAALADMWADNSVMLRVTLGNELFPHAAAAPELLARIDEFLATREADDLMLARVLAERRDMVERALRSRTLPG
jgi:aminopeptidase N